MSIGIPFAPGDVIKGVGLVRICPICGERCIEPAASYDENGEQTAPDAYQRHYYATHEEGAA
jgi:hypothetical protein